MKVWKLLVLAGIAAFLPHCDQVPSQSQRGPTPVRMGFLGADEEPPTFDSRESAAFFLGIHLFDDPRILAVPYGVDDAVDLAYTLAVELHPRRVDPARVVLALSGEPRKRESQQRLADLKAAGATVMRATKDAILEGIQRQAAAAGKNGILIASFATHGFSQAGTPYIVTSSSKGSEPESSISVSSLLDIAGASKAPRSIVFVDACRNRLTGQPGRGGQTDSRTAAPDAMSRATGQAVLWAAVHGGYAYDDDAKRNGVFTSAVIAGLKCEAERNGDGYVTANTLATFVSQRVRAWTNRKEKTATLRGTQASMDDAAKEMPLAQCGPAASGPEIDRIETAGTSFELFARNGTSLSKRDVGGRILHAEVADLHGNEESQAFVLVGDEGPNASHILAFDGNANEIWRWRIEGEPIAFVIGKFSKARRRAIAILSENDRESHVTVCDHRQACKETFQADVRLPHIALYQETAQSTDRILVAGTAQRDRPNTFLLKPEKGKLETFWAGRVSPDIDSVEIADFDGDRRSDLRLETKDGSVCITGKGAIIRKTGGADFHCLSLHPTNRR